MSVFAYTPEMFNPWAKGISECLNGGEESVGSCSRKFSEQVEKLVQPNVWTGPAAKKNYENFLETHQALIKFINSFGEEFSRAMKELSTNVAGLEKANLGETSVEALQMNYNQLNTLSEQNIATNEIRYDYATIISIGSALNQIKQTLDNVFSKLQTEIKRINDGSGMWDGASAQKNCEAILGVLEPNIKSVQETLNICISNISTAAESAQQFDN